MIDKWMMDKEIPMWCFASLGICFLSSFVRIPPVDLKMTNSVTIAPISLWLMFAKTHIIFSMFSTGVLTVAVMVLFYRSFVTYRTRFSQVFYYIIQLRQKYS